MHYKTVVFSSFWQLHKRSIVYFQIIPIFLGIDQTFDPKAFMAQLVTLNVVLSNVVQCSKQNWAKNFLVGLTEKLI